MQSVVLVTMSVPVRDYVERSLRTASLTVDHTMSPEQGTQKSRRGGAICLCSTEVDWRSIVSDLAAGPMPGPPVIVLLPTPDESVRARALRAGAFDVVRIREGRQALLQAIDYASAQWRRRQSVRSAVYIPATG